MSKTIVGHTNNSILIDANIDFVWDMTNQIESWPQLFTEYAKIEILGRHDNTVRFRATTRPDGSGTVSSWVVERTADRTTRRAVARYLEPGSFEYMNIEWIYTAEGRGTRMRWIQDFRMRPDAPISDMAMTNRINANTRVHMSTIREKIEQSAREQGMYETQIRLKMSAIVAEKAAQIERERKAAEARSQTPK
jgi:aromatase